MRRVPPSCNTRRSSSRPTRRNARAVAARRRRTPWPPSCCSACTPRGILEQEEEDLEEEEMDFKMVFVVNKSLELRPGNLALYTSRATVGLYRKINAQPQAVPVGPDELALWGEYGERMVVLWADSDQHIRDLELMARNLQLPCQMIEVKVSSELFSNLLEELSDQIS